jgi:anhydro-N-acetylmuramic acid kinase
MSGTSVDSIDAVLVDFSSANISIIGTHSSPIPEEIRNTIHNLALSGMDEIKQMRSLDQEIALLSSNAVNQVCQQSGHSNVSITAIGSHGQTIRHYPKDALNKAYSLQIGDPNIIAEETGITTVADFRRRDIAAGGHGAPLAPAFHKAAFSASNSNRIIVNTGGIANVTWLPINGEVIGYDTGPANGLMDSWCYQHRQTPYDKDGQWASSGTTNPALLKQLLAHPYFTTPPPKSTGRENFNLPWLHEQLTLFNIAISPEDVQATLLSLTAESISQQIERLDHKNNAEVYVCGGGAQNKALMHALSKRLQPRAINSTEALGIHPDWVEAVAFAWLAKNTMEAVTGNLPAVTGASKEVILGGIYLANR